MGRPSNSVYATVPDNQSASQVLSISKRAKFNRKEISMSRLCLLLPLIVILTMINNLNAQPFIFSEPENVLSISSKARSASARLPKVLLYSCAIETVM